MLIEIKGGQLFNMGASLMLQATLDQLSQRLPAARFVLRMHHLTPPERLADLETDRSRLLRKLPLRKKTVDLSRLSYLWPQRVTERLASRGYAFEGALDAIVDISGYAYADRWGLQPLAVAASEIERLVSHSGSYLFLPQAFGPFETISVPDKARFASALLKSDVVLSRDERSIGYLRELAGLGFTRIRLAPDLTIGYSVDAALAQGQPVDRQTALFVPNIRMLDSRQEPSRDRYLDTLTRLAETCHQRGYRPALLNHSEREDAALCTQLQQRWSAAGLPVGSVVSDSNPRRIKAILGRAGLVVSSRFHACVSAIDQQVPCIATSWSHKYDELYRQFEIADSLVREIEPSIAASWFQAWLDRPLAHRTACPERISALRQSVDTMWGEIASLLERKRRLA